MRSLSRLLQRSLSFNPDQSGADFDQKVSASSEKEKIKTYFTSIVEQSEMDNLLPEEVVNPPDEKAVED